LAIEYQPGRPDRCRPESWSLDDRAPNVPKEKWDFPEFSAEYRSNETSAVEVKFRGTAASFFEHLRFAPAAEIPVHATKLLFELGC
jgi:hypothetical protein